MTHWPEFMSKASDDALNAYIRDHKKYLPETIDAAIDELTNRGRPLPPDEVHAIRTAVSEAHQQQLRQLNGMSENMTSNPDDPELYSSTGIYWCAFLFGALFTSVLFCLNLARVRKTSWIIQVLIGGVAVTALQILVLPKITGGQILGGLVSIAYAFVLQHTLWKHITPSDLKFRPRNIWYPVLIGITLIVLFYVWISKLH